MPPSDGQTAATDPGGAAPPNPPTTYVPIVFVDMKEREEAERRRLRERLYDLERIRRTDQVLSPELQDELDDIKRKLDRQDIEDE